MQSQEVGALTRLARLGWNVEDTEEERLAKSVVTLTACLISVLSFVWVATYFTLGLVGAAAIPFTYQIVSVVSLLIFWRTKRLNFFRNSQLVMILFLPFLLQLSLGGFLRSSGVILWALMSPVGALMLLGSRGRFLGSWPILRYWSAPASCNRSCRDSTCRSQPPS